MRIRITPRKVTKIAVAISVDISPEKLEIFIIKSFVEL